MVTGERNVPARREEPSLYVRSYLLASEYDTHSQLQRSSGRIRLAHMYNTVGLVNKITQITALPIISLSHSLEEVRIMDRLR